jgi:hypothetical protein
MYSRRVSASWLSDDMAHALAAMWPSLEAADVLRAADRINERPAVREAVPN